MSHNPSFLFPLSSSTLSPRRLQASLAFPPLTCTDVCLSRVLHSDASGRAVFRWVTNHVWGKHSSVFVTWTFAGTCDRRTSEIEAWFRFSDGVKSQKKKKKKKVHIGSLRVLQLKLWLLQLQVRPKNRSTYFFVLPFFTYTPYQSWSPAKSTLNLEVQKQTCGHAVAQLVEALGYKLEGCGFDSRWCHWNFTLP